MDSIKKNVHKFLQTLLCTRRKKAEMDCNVFDREDIEECAIDALSDDLSNSLSYKDCESDCVQCEANEELDEKVYPTVKPIDISEENKKEVQKELEHKKENIWSKRNTVGNKAGNSSKRITLAQIEDAVNRQIDNLDHDDGARSPAKEESKIEKAEESPAQDITASYVKRVSEHPRNRLNKMWSRENGDKGKSLELIKRRRIYTNFSVKNIKLSKQYWKELIGLKINKNIPFVEYIPDEHSFKTKPKYLEYIKEFFTEKSKEIGIAEKVIDVPGFYSITSMSLKNFLNNSYYNEEIINSLLEIYQGQARKEGFLVFNTFSYHSIEKLVESKVFDDKLIKEEDITSIKGIIFPIMLGYPYCEVICVLARPNMSHVELVHHNSTVFGDKENPKADEIMETILHYIEGYIIIPNTQDVHEVTDSRIKRKVPQWKRSVKSLKRVKYRAKKIEGKGMYQKIAIKDDTPPQIDKDKSGKMIANFIIRMCSKRYMADDQTLKNMAFLELLFGDPIL
ncbi:unnamed protein product [Moneuplotes crassus]|uniref:Uncharacterized protein n=1 Tax=Euplotes crassus TaxID=5936 RepID=A0AAD1UDI5_EUPCR|nr:unnamed protein product [Moneuplotes crassus]